MKRNAIILLSLIGLSIVMLATYSVLTKAKDTSQNAAEPTSDSLYSVHEESMPAIDIEIRRTGYGPLDDWLKNRATEIETQYVDNIGTFGGETFQEPMLRVVSATDEWGKYVNAVLDVYEYTGGAHGMPYIETAVFNKETGAFVGLGDVFGTNEYLPQLSRLMIGKVSDLHEVFDGDTVRQALQPSATNFEVWHVGSDGVTFYYNPYEVAPFSTGIVSVLVTWEEIEAFKK